MDMVAQECRRHCIGTHGRPRVRHQRFSARATWSGPMAHMRPRLRPAAILRRRFSAKAGSVRTRSDLSVFGGVTTSRPPTTCKPRRTWTRPERKSTSDQSSPHASHLRSPSVAAQRTTASKGAPAIPRSMSRSWRAESTCGRYGALRGSSTPAVGSAMRRRRRRMLQRMTCRRVLYAFSAAPASSKPSTQRCTSSGSIRSTSIEPQRGSTWRLRALSYPSIVVARSRARFSSMYMTTAVETSMACPIDGSVAEIPGCRARAGPWACLGFYARP